MTFSLVFFLILGTFFFLLLKIVWIRIMPVIIWEIIIVVLSQFGGDGGLMSEEKI